MRMKNLLLTLFLVLASFAPAFGQAVIANPFTNLVQTQASFGGAWRETLTIYPGSLGSFPFTGTFSGSQFVVQDGAGVYWRIRNRQTSAYPSDTNCVTTGGNGFTGYSRIEYGGSGQFNFTNDWNSNTSSLDSGPSNYPSVTNGQGCLHIVFSRVQAWDIQRDTGSGWTTYATINNGRLFPASPSPIGAALVYYFNGSSYYNAGTTATVSPISRTLNGQPTILVWYVVGAEFGVFNVAGIDQQVGGTIYGGTIDYAGASPYANCQQINLRLSNAMPTGTVNYQLIGHPTDASGILANSGYDPTHTSFIQYGTTTPIMLTLQ